MRLSSAALVAFAASAAFHPSASRADGPGDTRLREALRTTTSQLRALEDERSTWQAKEAALQKELETLRAQAKAAGGVSSRASDRSLAELRRKVADQAEASAKVQEALAQCQAAVRDGAEAARVREDERLRLKADATDLGARLAASEARNARLYRVGKDIVDWLSRVGVSGAIAAREPFLGLKRVEMEKIAQDYEDKLLEEKAKP